MNIPIGSVIFFTRTNSYNGDKYDLLGEYLDNTTSTLSMVTIKVLEGHHKKGAPQYFPIDVLDTAIVLYPNVTAFYDENPEYLL